MWMAPKSQVHGEPDERACGSVREARRLQRVKGGSCAIAFLCGASVKRQHRNGGQQCWPSNLALNESQMPRGRGEPGRGCEPLHH
jgi:hypothetical protein